MMGYNYKQIDKRRPESPFLILEKSIYKNLNVGTLAKIIDISDVGCKLQSIPTGVMFNSSYYLEDTTYSKGDLVVVLFLDNYGTEQLNEATSNIMHDYQNSVILGKAHKFTK